MMRFAGAAPVVFAAPTAGRDSFRTLAHRAFCERLIRLRADADTPRFGLVPPPPNLPRTERAASTCRSSFTRLVLIVLNSVTKPASPVRFAMNPPRQGIVIDWLILSDWCRRQTWLIDETGCSQALGSLAKCRGARSVDSDDTSCRTQACTSLQPWHWPSLPTIRKTFKTNDLTQAQGSGNNYWTSVTFHQPRKTDKLAVWLLQSPMLPLCPSTSKNVAGHATK